MGPSPTLVAPGLRTAAHTGWRSGVSWAVSVVVEQPSLWLLGALGYLLRGGVVVLTLAILVLPSPVSVRLMLGGYLGSSGLTPEFYVAAGVALLLLGVLALLSMVLTAAVDVAAFERFVSRTTRPGGARPGGATPSTPSRQARRRLVAALVLVQVVGLVALLLAAVPLMVAAAQATYAELLRPNLAGGALYDRVLAQLGQPLFVLLLGLLLVEMVSAVASRRLMARAFGLAGGSREVGSPEVKSAAASVPKQALTALAAGLARPIARPFSTLPTALLGWLAMLAVLLPLAWALPLVWRAVRSQFLAVPTVEALPALLLATALLSLVWLAGLGVVGFASALRAGLWSSEELR